MSNLKTIFNKKLLEKKYKKDVDLDHPSILPRREILDKWIKMLESGILDKLKEEQLQGEFVSDIFSKILRGVNVTDGKEEWNIIREEKTKVDGTKADAVIGFFSNLKSDIRALIELKSPKTNLDMKQKSRTNNQSPIEQAFGYHHKYGKNCKWIIVSNYKEIRLYSSSDSTEYEVFYLDNLKNDDEFQRFLYLLSFKSLINQSEKSIVEKLWEDNIKEQKKIEDKFYKIYHKTRLSVFNHIKQKNQEINLNIILSKTQKLMDRFIFICFAEDKGLLPENIFRNIVERGKTGYSGIWSEFKGLCQAINNGSPNHNINKFNGGLFADDNILDNLKIHDNIFEELLEISTYDFDSELNENILGHIFEQSISDLEEIKAEINEENFDKKSGKRKKDGVFYTPKYITKYIVENSVGIWLEDKKIELGFENLPELSEDDFKSDYYKSGKYKGARRYTPNYLEHISFWKNYRDIANKIKILDPACGSGAFLIEAFQYLHKLKIYINEQLGNLAIEYSDLPDEKVTLQNNLFGVDLNSESVEITKLALWLKTANKGKELTSLDNNIKCGNSLIDDNKVAGNKTFKWELEFKEIIDNGGFDVVIGNPPYVRQESIKKMEKDFYFNKYLNVKNYSADIYVYFYELGISILKENGYLAYISPNKWMERKYGDELRTFLKRFEIKQIINFGELKIFKDASTEPAIIVIKNKKSDLPINYAGIKNINTAMSGCYEFSKFEKSNLKEDIWRFSEEIILSILEKFNSSDITLNQYTNGGIYYGIKTGLNKTFIITKKKRDEIISKEPSANEIIEKMVEGDDFNGWSILHSERYMIATQYDLDIPNKYPVVYEYLKQFEEKLIKRSDKGRNFWNLRACDYYDKLKEPKIIYYHTAKKHNFYLDSEGYYISANCYFISNADKYLQCLLNSSLFHCVKKYLFPAFGDAENGGRVRLDSNKMVNIKIKKSKNNELFYSYADKMTKLNSDLSKTVNQFTSYIQEKWKNIKYTNKISNFYTMDFSTFLKELNKQKIKLSGKDEYNLKEIFDNEVAKINNLRNEIDKINNEINQMIYQVYGLTKEEIRIVEKDEH